MTFGGAMFAAFPDAYATVFCGFYSAFMLLLFALIFRAVSIEFRSKISPSAWRAGLGLRASSSASLLATLLFGVAVGNVDHGRAAGRARDVHRPLARPAPPLPLLVGVMAVAMFAMHGAIYLYLKTEGELHAGWCGWIWRSFGLFLTLLPAPDDRGRWSDPAGDGQLRRSSRWLWVVPVLNVLAIANIPRSLVLGRPAAAFVSSSFNIFAYVFLLMTALWPNIIVATDPAYSLSLSDAASSNRTLVIGLIVVAVGMPFVVAYSAVVYWTFRGKVRLEPHSY